MSEEIKSKAIELSDEEMDRVSGGKAIVVTIKHKTFCDIDYCDYWQMTPDVFESMLNGGECSRWISSDPHVCCDTCDHHHYDCMSLSAAPAFLDRIARDMGYQYKYVNKN